VAVRPTRAPAVADSCSTSMDAFWLTSCSNFSTWLKVAVWDIIWLESTGFPGSW
jgi:hypothetical protein